MRALFKPSFEGLGVHGVVVGLGRDDAPQTQAADERNRLVMAMRNAAAQALTAPKSAIPARHVGGRRGLVDENQFHRVEVKLSVERSPSTFEHVEAVLLARVRRLFYM